MSFKKLPREFFRRPTLKVAAELIGKVLVVNRNGRRMSGRIVECEAYIGEDDPACHARFGPTSRSAIMYGDAGYLYVYFIYGMYDMLNIVTEPTGRPAAILIRALEPIDGIEFMQENRGVQGHQRLTSGPGKLCRALAITTQDTGASVTGREFQVIDDGYRPRRVATSPRIGIGAGHDLLWRFYDAQSTFVSRK